MLLIAILRAAIGLAIIGLAIAGFVMSFMTEGVGCFGSVVLFVFFIALFIAQSAVDEATLEAFMGMDPVDYMCIILVAMVGGFLLSGTHIAGLGTSAAVGFTGLMITGFLDPTQIATLSDAVLNMGIVVMLPIVLPATILIIVVGLLCRGL